MFCTLAVFQSSVLVTGEFVMQYLLLCVHSATDLQCLIIGKYPKKRSSLHPLGYIIAF